MKGVLIRGGKSKIGIVSKMLLVAAALMIVVGLGTATRAEAVSSNATKKLLLGEMSLFNPFTLQSTSISAAESESGTEGDSGLMLLLGAGTKSRPPIRIPYRPPLRSPFRPPL